MDYENENQDVSESYPQPPQSYSSPYGSSGGAPPPSSDPKAAVPTVGNYVVVQLLSLIPIAGFILLIIWAVGGGNEPRWRTNYARAYWVMYAIGIALGIIVFVLLTVIGIGPATWRSDSLSDF
jgi:hypothetical protein